MSEEQASVIEAFPQRFSGIQPVYFEDDGTLLTVLGCLDAPAEVEDGAEFIDCPEDGASGVIPRLVNIRGEGGTA